VQAASTPENIVQFGPSVEIAFTPSTAFSFGYSFESDLKDRTAHNLNAALHVRF
jgi:hypothetical protein